LGRFAWLRPCHVSINLPLVVVFVFFVMIGLIISGLVFVALLCLLVNVGLCLGGVRREGGRLWCSSSLLGGSLALLSTFIILGTCSLVSLARSEALMGCPRRGLFVVVLGLVL
jgi:hypothetical protein